MAFRLRLVFKGRIGGAPRVTGTSNPGTTAAGKMVFNVTTNDALLGIILEDF